VNGRCRTTCCSIVPVDWRRRPRKLGRLPHEAMRPGSFLTLGYELSVSMRVWWYLRAFFCHEDVTSGCPCRGLLLDAP